MEKISVEIKASYRGYKISFSEWDNQWSVEIGEEKEAYSAIDIKKVKEYVDKIIKNEFKPIEALCRIGWCDDTKIEKITISSLDSQEKDKVWVIDSNGKRSKEDKENLFSLSEDNLNKVKKIKEIDKHIEELNKENRGIYKSLTKAL
jgi:hypothetical protein